MDQEHLLLDFERLQLRLELAVRRVPIDLDFLEFVSSQELGFLSAISSTVTLPLDIVDILTELQRHIENSLADRSVQTVSILLQQGPMGRPWMVISPDYNIVIFGGIDGFSRKIMYLGAAPNNLASTTLQFFQESVETFGFPLRVRGDQGIENVDVARLMFTVHGTERSSFISGKSVRNQRIERLWRDVWTSVTNVYYDVLHSLEEGGYLDLSDRTHLFCCHYVFLPRLQDDLNVFRNSWDNHPLRTEGNMTPNQLWFMGSVHYPVLEGLSIPHTEWENSGLSLDAHSTVTVPVVESPLNDEQLAALRQTINPKAPSQTFGWDIYLATLQFLSQLLAE